MACESYYPGAPCDTNHFVSACKRCKTEYGRVMQDILQDDEQQDDGQKKPIQWGVEEIDQTYR